MATHWKDPLPGPEMCESLRVKRAWPQGISVQPETQIDHTTFCLSLISYTLYGTEVEITTLVRVLLKEGKYREIFQITAV